MSERMPPYPMFCFVSNRILICSDVLLTLGTSAFPEMRSIHTMPPDKEFFCAGRVSHLHALTVTAFLAAQLVHQLRTTSQVLGQASNDRGKEADSGMLSFVSELQPENASLPISLT